MSLENWSLVVIVSILAGLDRTAIASTTLCRPLVCAALLGFMLDIFTPALQLGIMLELLWLMRLPVGASVAPDDTQAALSAVVLIKLFLDEMPQHNWELVIFVALLVVVLAEAGKCFDVWARHINEHLFMRAQHYVELGRCGFLAHIHYCGMLVFAASSLLSLGFTVAVSGALLSSGIGYVDDIALMFPVRGPLIMLCFPVVGVAATLAVLRIRHSVVLFVSGFAVTLTFLEML
ncbi:MAG: hypothetical protein B6I36_02690 [Desulfobacteraceae bacterium 4572_35.1]|nr:MAG: hypothetical protein B6I36_02690 [Desulfobacteraceae bacterium 4572_35.1]